MVRIGDRFGAWVVLDGRERHIAGTAKAYGVLCRCDCGEERLVRVWFLVNGKSLGCRTWCYARQAKPAEWHRLYIVWNGMKARCYNPTSDRYATYGGRGIKVCRRWARFRNFYIDMLPLWEEGLWIERRDLNGDYTPSNCYFTTQLRQANNKTNTKWVEVRGERMSLADAVRQYAVVPYDTAKRRINVQGMEVWPALTTPLIGQKDRIQKK